MGVEKGVQGLFRFKAIKVINAVSKMFLEASVLGLHATMSMV